MRVIIVGQDKPVYFLARQFSDKGYDIHIITPDRVAARDFSRQLKATVLVGDGTEMAMQEEAGARNADVLVALMEQDEDNLITCQVGQRVFGIPRTIALIHDPANEAIFKQLGISATVSVVQIITLMVEEQVGFEEVTNLVTLARGRITISELVLTPDAPVINQTLSAVDLPASSLVATVVRDDEVIIPSGTTRFLSYDRLILITQPDSYDEVMRKLTGKGIHRDRGRASYAA